VPFDNFTDKAIRAAAALGSKLSALPFSKRFSLQVHKQREQNYSTQQNVISRQSFDSMHAGFYEISTLRFNVWPVSGNFFVRFLLYNCWFTGVNTCPETVDRLVSKRTVSLWIFVLNFMNRLLRYIFMLTPVCRSNENGTRCGTRRCGQ